MPILFVSRNLRVCRYMPAAMLALRTLVAQCPALQAALQVLPNYQSELNCYLTALSLRRLVVTSSYRVILFRQTINS
jgi:hypothetical protein